MAGSKSDYLEKKFLDWLYGNNAFSPPATVYVALSTGAYTDAATGTSMNEVTGGGYARASVANNTTNFPASTGTNPTTKTNGTAIVFPTASAAYASPVLSVYLVDAATGGNVLHGSDITSQTIASGDTPTIAASALTITED
jgi:hypothetical protein